MTATERVEAVNAARHTLIQAATGLVIIGGVLFTAQGLWYTAQSLDASRQAQLTAQEGQIVDRYTKAVEQLGSAKLDVRLGGTYALERLAQDSPRDRQTVYDVLAAFVREHDPKPSVEDEALPAVPATDVLAALTAICRQDGTEALIMPDLGGIRTPGADLRYAKLRDAYLLDANLSTALLTGADLRDATLRGAQLTGAYLSTALLSDADLISAKLTRADLRGADLRGTWLTGADLSDADLSDAKLTGAYLSTALLTGADLSGADLTRAELIDADLTGADLTGTNLTNVRGVTESEIRKVAKVDATTIF